MLGGRDEVEVFGRIARSVRQGGALAVSAFSAAFAVRHLESGEEFDPSTGVLHETATVRDPGGREQDFELWTTCFTPRELELLASAADLDVVAVYGVTPGRYRAEPPNLDHHELLLVAAPTLTPTSTFGPGGRACTLVRGLAPEAPHSRPPGNQRHERFTIA